MQHLSITEAADLVAIDVFRRGPAGPDSGFPPTEAPPT